MNTKGIKFLAVLAVMAMAFAAVIVLAPADNDTVAVSVFGNKDVAVDQTVIEEKAGGITQFYFSDDTTVKVKSLAGNSIFYVENGKELEINFKWDKTVTNEYTVTIVSVTGDQQRPTTSIVDDVKDEDNKGKILIEKTSVEFVPSAGQTVVYNAMMPITVVTHPTSGDKIVTIVNTKLGFDQHYATIGSDSTLSEAEIGEFVTVASGQAVDVSPKGGDLSKVQLSYGIRLLKNSAYTYYAKGMNAGTETITTADEVNVVNGTIIVNIDSGANVRMTSVSGNATITTADDKVIKVDGSISSGSMTIAGKVTFGSPFTAGSSVTLTGTADVQGGQVKVTGELILKNDAAKIAKMDIDGNGKIIAQNEKLWTYTGTKPDLMFKNGETPLEQTTFTGLADVSAITKSADVKEAFSTAKIERNQTFVVIADTVVTTSLSVEGVLIIQPGVTLTITKTNDIGADLVLSGQYGQIINNGEILIKTTQDPTPAQATITDEDQHLAGLHIFGGYALNEGRIIASSDNKTGTQDTLVVDFAAKNGRGIGLVNNGVITVSKNDNVAFDDNFVNGSKGSITVNGSIRTTGENNGLVNKGSFTASNATIKSALSVSMASGAEFNLSSATVAKNVTITVNAVSMGSVKGHVSITTPGDVDEYTVRGLKVVDVLNALDVSGSIGVTVPNTVENPAPAVLSMGGKILVSDSATVGTGYKVTFDASTTVDVSGSLTMAKGVVIDPADAANVTLYVDGIVTTVEADMLKGCTYVAAKFVMSNNTTIYTTLEDAIAAAVLADVSIVEVGTDVANEKAVIVYDDLLIPAGMTVISDSALNGKGVLLVDGKATVYVQSTARLDVDFIVVEDGMIIAESVNDVDMGNILADVIVEDDSSTAAEAMSLEVALMLATPGDVISLSNTFYGKDETLVIPEGVTVDATAVDGTDFFLSNSNLVVNGTLVVNEFIFVATYDDTIGITLNGYIYDACSGGKCFNGWWYVPFGVSYYQTSEDGDVVWFVLTSIENIQPAINVADDAKVRVTGNANIDSLDVKGREDMPAEVTFEGNVNVGNINIDDVTLVFLDKKKVTTTVSDAYGSITITGAYVKDKLSIYNLDEAGVYMAGSVTDNAKGTYSIRFDGITGIDGTTKTAIAWGAYDESAPTIIFAGETIVTGKRAVISYDDEYDDKAMVTITGVLFVDNGSKLKVFSSVQVLGSFIAAEKIEDEIAGSVEVEGHIFVGALESEIYDADAAVKAYEADREFAAYDGYGQSMYIGEMAATATVSGNVELGKGYAVIVGYDDDDQPIYEIKPFFITVMNGSIVDPAIVEDMASVDVIIEDTVWLTVYGYEGSAYSLDGLKAPVVNAKVDKIYDANGNEIAKYSHDYKVIYGCDDMFIEYYGAVVVVLDYDVFTIEIKTDGSVKAVYIDGILMRTGQNANIFLLENVATGTHKVTVEPSAGYTAEGCILYTDYGTILPNMTFTFTEYDCDDYMVTYDIKGTAVEPEPVPPTPEEESQWTITTILLVILVVLIAIMAVIVALRLNRS